MGPLRVAIGLSVLLVVAGFALSAAPANADPDLTPPWPDGMKVADIPGEAVSFPSHSPFTLADVGAGGEEDPATTARGTLFLPKRASAQAPVPAVVLLHGASGVLGAREMTYARQFATRGVAALVVDAFAPRRDRATRFVDRLIEITEAMLLADAHAALKYLDARPDVDGTRVVLIGFSYGGMAATYAAYAQVAEAYAPEGVRFAGHVAFYAPCIARFEDARATGAPLLILYGSRDAIIDPARCAEVAAQLKGGGAAVETIVYDGAVHQWDGYFAGPREIGRTLAPCRFVVEPDGTVRDARWLVPMSGPLTRKVLLALCAGSDGYLIGRDDRVRARSNADLARFLMRIFEPGGAG